jgi:hypothetical protein
MMRKHQQRGSQILSGTIEVPNAYFVEITGEKCKRLTLVRESNDSTEGVGPNPVPVAISTARTSPCNVLAGSKNPNLDRTLIIDIPACQGWLEIPSALSVASGTDRLSSAVACPSRA